MKRRRSEANTAIASVEDYPDPSPGLRKSKRGATITAASSRPSRLQPSGPLHMTTRAASKAASNSISPSTDGFDTRRNSFAQVGARLEDPFEDNARPSKRRRKSSETGLSSNNSSQPSGNSTNIAETHSTQSHSATRIPAGARKQRRTSSTDDNNHSHGLNGTLSEEVNGDNEILNERAAPNALHRAKRRGRGRQTLQSELPVESADVTPAPGSPALSDIENEDVEQAEDGTRPSSNAPAKAVKKLPGRRRAPHSNINIEVDLRRQLQLKMGYRAIVKALKPVLAELAERTMNEVEVDPKAHKQYDEYETVMSELNARLEQRLTRIRHLHQLRESNINGIKEWETERLNQTFEDNIRNLQDDYVTRCKNQLLQTVRDADKQDGDATDDEDAIIPPLQGAQYPCRRTGKLPAEYYSRCRYFMETEGLWTDCERRQLLQEEQERFLKENAQEFEHPAMAIAGGFASFDGPPRHYTRAHLYLQLMGDAAEELDRRAKASEKAKEDKVKILPNEEAWRLQILADLSSAQPILVHGTRKRAKTVAKQPAAIVTTPTRPTFLSSGNEPPSAASTAMSLESESSTTSPRKLPGSRSLFENEMARPQTATEKPFAPSVKDRDQERPMTHALKEEAQSEPLPFLQQAYEDRRPPIAEPPKSSDQVPPPLTIGDALELGLIHEDVPDLHDAIVAHNRRAPPDEQIEVPERPQHERRASAPQPVDTRDEKQDRFKRRREASPQRTPLDRIRQNLAFVRRRTPEFPERRPERWSASDEQRTMPPPPQPMHSYAYDGRHEFSRPFSPHTPRYPGDHGHSRDSSSSEGRRYPWEEQRRASTGLPYPPYDSPGPHHPAPAFEYRPSAVPPPPHNYGERRAPIPPPPQTHYIAGPSGPPPFAYLGPQGPSPRPPQEIRSQHGVPHPSSAGHHPGHYGPHPPPQSPYVPIVPHGAPHSSAPPYPGPPPPLHQPYQGHPQYPQPVPPPPYPGPNISHAAPQSSVRPDDRSMHGVPPPPQYAGSQYGGQPILPASMDPRSQYSSSSHGGGPPHLPAFSQQQAHHRGSLPQHHSSGPPRRRHKSYGGVANSEFRRYTGPKQQ